MDITEEQRKRAEANRLAAIAKRKALVESSNGQLQRQDPWKLFKCRKLSTELSAASAVQSSKRLSCNNTHLPERFRVRLEISSPDSFSITPEAVEGYSYPGEENCFRKLSDFLFNVTHSHYTQIIGGGKACVYKLRDYCPVLKCLKNSKDIDVYEIPWTTFNVVERLSHSFTLGRWMPCRPEHLSDEKVDELMQKLPDRLLNRLLPFQLDGVRFGLQRGGRCLIADEMGLGKTLQAIAIASCLMDEEGSMLVVCPAVLRFSWAEELERWLPFCLPSDIHLVFGHLDNPCHLSKFPKVVVISYTMLHRLCKSILQQKWSLLIVDESHHVRCAKKSSESEEIKAVLDLSTKVQHIILLSGTPSLSRPYDIFHQIDMLWPGLLGKTKYEFAKTYCDVKFVRTSQGKTFKDFSKGIRLDELNVLLKQTVMIRRLKEHVLVQLPPKRRQIIRLLLKSSDIVGAKAATREVINGDQDRNAAENNTDDILGEEEPDDGGACGTGKLSFHELGVAKLSGFREWFSIHPIISETDGLMDLDLKTDSQKMIIFAHHHKVLDGVQELMCEKGIQFVRIDGTTLARDRQSAVLLFQSSSEVKIAIIGITAGGVGLDFSSAQNVVFLELPQSPSLMLQAEDRAHRRGQTKAVNIYIFCAKDTIDESHWRKLNKSLRRVTSTTDGKYDAIQEIAVERVSYLEACGRSGTSSESQMNSATCIKLSSKIARAQGHGSLEVEVNDELNGSFKVLVKDELNAKTDYPPDQNDDIDITTQTDQVAIKGEMLSGQLNNDSLSMEKSEENLTTVDNRSLESSSCPPLEKQGGEKDQAEKEEKLCSGTSKVDNGEPHLITEPEKSSLNHVHVLRFEISQYTGRVHLYRCIPGIDLRPRPLFLNFRPEEVELIDCSVDDSEKTDFNLDATLYKLALQEFLSEWRKLRPIEQRKLYGKPLQLPLDIELCYLKESINHNADGVLKGKSLRRTTPIDDISRPLPSSAVWKLVQLCCGSGKRKKEYSQGWTLTDEPLCKLCQTPCQGINAKTPEYFEDLFCNLGCYEEYRVRISSTSLRRELFQMEHGVCSNCHLDCHKLVKHIRPLSVEMRRDYIEKVAPKLASRKNLLEKIVNNPTEGNAWHADHIVPVYRGGGECRLENMRTLCVGCHFDVTAEQRAERRLVRLKAKKQLRDTITDIKKSENTERIDNDIQNRVHDAQENVLDEQLILVKVPGSAYSKDDCLDNNTEGPEESTAA
ncbi:DNA annealing helicase and endonuclease ZRANB3 [Cucurbita pepo subsp. pepo]|uniref:DNA annealing helicase and endonuclease ZRANB3 n=1 Tax=Cucurbita pepo subsp. pepo TaxID=3664 RepID=UPI000C9D750E|nr:DNA annealing helicase and endonuclease ZRANB3 [Cucurbita pepo subsp. pepo]